MSTQDILLDSCLNVLKQENVKQHIKLLFIPIIEMLLKELYPFIMISIIFMVLSFFLILGNFLLLMRSNNNKYN
jgi:hypothetical protein